MCGGIGGCWGQLASFVCLVVGGGGGGGAYGVVRLEWKYRPPSLCVGVVWRRILEGWRKCKGLRKDQTNKQTKKARQQGSK